MRDVREGGMGARKVAQKWALKKSSLQTDRLNGRVTFDRRKDPLPGLTKNEENQLAD